jgi:acetyl esterase/lipase
MGPASLWHWVLTIAAVVALPAVPLAVYIGNRAGRLLRRPPVLLLVPSLLAAILAGIAYWSRAWLAITGFGLATIIGLLLALRPALQMWQMARQHNIAVSPAAHFAIKTYYPQVDSARTTRNVVYGKADGTELLLDAWPAIGPARGALRPAFVKLHGGAWLYGAKGEGPAWNLWLNELGYWVFDVEYRLPPPARWQDEVGDVKSALGWVVANAERHGIDPLRISITGHSAGGNLAMLAAFSVGSRDLPPSCAAPDYSIKSVVNFYGPTDLTTLSATAAGRRNIRRDIHRYIGGTVAEYPERYKAVSPLTWVNSSSPPTITLHGRNDRIVPIEQADRLDHALAGAGVMHETYLLPGAGHAFDGNWNSLATQFSRAKIKAFLAKYG